MKPEFDQQTISDGIQIKKEGPEGICEFTFQLEERVAWALNAALATQRPLLVLGKPGVGKSELALAAATKLKCKPLFFPVTSRTEAEDLYFKFDAVARLSRAQAANNIDADKLNDIMDNERYLTAGPFWEAINPKTAQKFLADKRQAKNDSEQKYSVLLIDEIDKADSDVPNSLLDALDQKRFNCPFKNDDKIIRQDNGLTPLVIFTSNEERDLPPAFIRRCLVLKITMGENDAEVRKWLLKRIKAHFPEPDHLHLWSDLFDHDRETGQPTKSAVDKAMDLIIEGQNTAEIAPSLAELLDLLTAVNRLVAESDEKQQKVVEAFDFIQEFTLQKSKAFKG